MKLKANLTEEQYKTTIKLLVEDTIQQAAKYIWSYSSEYNTIEEIIGELTLELDLLQYYCNLKAIQGFQSSPLTAAHFDQPQNYDRINSVRIAESAGKFTDIQGLLSNAKLILDFVNTGQVPTISDNSNNTKVITTNTYTAIAKTSDLVLNVKEGNGYITDLTLLSDGGICLKVNDKVNYYGLIFIFLNWDITGFYNR